NLKLDCMKLRADSIHKYYGKLPVLTGAYLSCEPGEVVGLVGRNACGKSTLLRVIMRLVPAESAFVEIGDTYIKGAWQLPGRMAYLSQDSWLPDHLRIRKVIRLYCPKALRKSVMEHPWIQPFLDRKCHQVSAGQLRLIECLVVLNSKAPFLLLDEPFNGIAPVQKEEIVKLIRHHALELGKGIVITDHDYRKVWQASTRLVVVKDRNTYTLKQKEDLQDFGYLPGSAWQ
ncbi:MAG: ATP-binding cassette domain-containing protein, partial [Bacteroidota bacterium]